MDPIPTLQPQGHAHALHFVPLSMERSLQFAVVVRLFGAFGADGGKPHPNSNLGTRSLALSSELVLIERESESESVCSGVEYRDSSPDNRWSLNHQLEASPESMVRHRAPGVPGCRPPRLFCPATCNPARTYDAYRTARHMVAVSQPVLSFRIMLVDSMSPRPGTDAVQDTLAGHGSFMRQRPLTGTG
jgi:hypothetical protein